MTPRVAAECLANRRLGLSVRITRSWADGWDGRNNPRSYGSAHRLWCRPCTRRANLHGLDLRPTATRLADLTQAWSFRWLLCPWGRMVFSGPPLSHNVRKLLDVRRRRLKAAEYLANLQFYLRILFTESRADGWRPRCVHRVYGRLHLTWCGACSRVALAQGLDLRPVAQKLLDIRRRRGTLQ